MNLENQSSDVQQTDCPNSTQTKLAVKHTLAKSFGKWRIVILILCLGSAFCAWFLVSRNTVSHRLSEQVRRGPGTVVDFTEVAPFPWDRLYVFGPYTPAQRIHDSLGIHWPDAKSTSIEYSDVVNLVVFVQNRQVVYWFEHLRNQGDLFELASSMGYSREEANFEVCTVGSEHRLALRKRH